MNWGLLVLLLSFVGALDACDLTLVVDGAHVRASHADRDELRCRYAGKSWDSRAARCWP